MGEIAVPADTELPTKNTFVHFDTCDSEYELPPRKEATCPDLVQRRAFRTKTFLKRRAQQKALLHAHKQCKPCAYFAYKADGCRNGEDCEHCHLCTRPQIRRRKRLHAVSAAAAGAAAKASDVCGQ